MGRALQNITTIGASELATLSGGISTAAITTSVFASLNGGIAVGGTTVLDISRRLVNIAYVVLPTVAIDNVRNAHDMRSPGTARSTSKPRPSPIRPRG